MPIGDDISEPIPPVGTAGNSYAAQLVAFLQEVKARLEARIALTSLLAGVFDLENHGIDNAQYLALYEQLSAPSTPIGSLQRYGGELYYVSPSGAVRITNNGGLDVVAANGITGDYAAPAEFKYDLGALEYFAYSNESAGQWARVGAQGFDVYGTLSSTTRVRIGWGGGSSYTLTLPATVPASQQIVQMDASGNLTASNTIPQNMTFALDKGITLSGLGRVHHDNISKTQVFKSDWVPLGTMSFSLNATGTNDMSISLAGVSTTAYAKIDNLEQGDIISSVIVYSSGATGGAANCVYTLYYARPSLGNVLTQIATTSDQASSVTLTPASAHTVAAGDQLYVKVVTPASGAYAFYSIQPVYAV